MRQTVFIAFWLAAIASFESVAQEYGFPMSSISAAELGMKTYPGDTSATAVILNEFGNAYIENGDHYNLVLDYHVKIKILRREGFSRADFSIPLAKSKDNKMTHRAVTGATYNYDERGVMKESKLNTKDVFLSEEENYNYLKFTLPDIREGSIIEVTYTIENPFIFNFWPWEFQSDIPKIYSEFWASIPGNYTYNIVLKGPFPLVKNESSIVKDCFTPNGNRSDCALYKYAMRDIPGFREEPYMTAKSNFLAMINYELSSIKYFDGRFDRFTREWKDVDQELQKEERFGIQIRRAKGLFEDAMRGKVSGGDPLSTAQSVYRFVANHFTWNEKNSKYSDLGVKKAFENRVGNTGDINLSLVGALQAMELTAYPVILSTRRNGTPIELHPVLSDYNYVIAAVDIQGKIYLVDATEKDYAFGLLPERCLNGKGRMLSKEPSWIELKPIDKDKKVTSLTLKLNADGKFMGDLTIEHAGYEAADFRSLLRREGGPEAHKKKLEESWKATISGYELQGLENPEMAVTEKMNVVLEGFDDMNARTYFLDPFFSGKWGKNPFTSVSRQYPVDFGAPMELTFILNLEYPEELSLDGVPTNTALTLPQGGGRYFFNIVPNSNKLNLTSRLLLNKTVYTSREYASLREMFSRIIESEGAQIVFKRK